MSDDKGPNPDLPQGDTGGSVVVGNQGGDVGNQDKQTCSYGKECQGNQVQLVECQKKKCSGVLHHVFQTEYMESIGMELKQERKLCRKCVDDAYGFVDDVARDGDEGEGTGGQGEN